jgi:hypothetical protein
VAANESAATAFEIASLPTTITVDAPSGTGVLLWWSYLAQAGDLYLAVLARSSGANFVQRLTVKYGSNTASLTTLLSANDGLTPVDIPVTPGLRYWFAVEDTDAGSNSGLTLTLTVRSQPTTPLRPGDVLVPDENYGQADGSAFPAVSMDPDTGDVISVVPYIASEVGAILPSGISLVQSLENGGFYLYDAQATLLDTITSVTSSGEPPIASDRDATFYIATRSSGVTTAAVIRTISDAGVVGGTSWTLPTGTGIIRAIAVTRDGSTLLYRRSGGTTIETWNLLTDAAGATFASGLPVSAVKELLVLSDGTVITASSTLGSPASITVSVLSSAGVLLHTFEIDGGRANPRLAFAQNDSATSFWIRRFGLGFTGGTTVSEMLVSSGAVVREWEVGEFNGMVGPADGEAGDPPPEYGPSESCPFWIVESGVGVIGPLAWGHWPRVIPATERIIG